MKRVPVFPDTRFDLGDFEIDREVAQILPYAEVLRLVRAHGRGDWGRVTTKQIRDNEAFAHPKNRLPLSFAQSVHRVGTSGMFVSLKTRQERGRRKTRLSLA